MGTIFKDKLIKIIEEEKNNNDEDFELHEHQKKMIGSSEQDNSIDTMDSSSNNIELLKPDNHVSIIEFMRINDLKEFKMLFNPESLYVHYYVVLDSNYRDITEENSSNITKFKWRYAPYKT